MSADRAEFSGTRIYVGGAKRNDRYVHVLAYQNAAKNLSDRANAMILPFPASTPMNEENVIDTTEFKDFLEDISNASKTRPDRRRSLGADNDLLGSDSYALVFDSGSYTVVLASNADQIGGVLERVPANKRPTFNNAFLRDFGNLYPDHQIALCCWDGSIEAEPLLWWYEPKNPGTYFIPTMDAHDGNAPDTTAMVATDHVISIPGVGGKPVHYRNDNIPAHVRELLPTTVHGGRPYWRMRNGDMKVTVADIKEKYESKGGPTLIRMGTKQPDICEVLMNGWRE